MESFDKRVYSVSASFQSALKHQMSAVATMILARKLRVCVTDPSGLVLQSLGQLNEKSNPGQLQLIQNSDVRKKFSVLAKQPEESLSNCGEIVPTFSSSVPTFSNSFIHSAYMLPTQGESSTNNSSSYNSPSTHESKCGALTHSKSSPNLSVLPKLLGSPQNHSNKALSISSQYMHRNEAHSELSESVHSNTDNTAIMPSALSPSDAQKPMQSNSQQGANSIGFGILSRTRQFGAWLTKATEGGKVEITKQDLNALAPNSF